jgi:hypothetical protein
MGNDEGFVNERPSYVGAPSFADSPPGRKIERPAVIIVFGCEALTRDNANASTDCAEALSIQETTSVGGRAEPRATRR